jgi:hypothetical protein
MATVPPYVKQFLQALPRSWDDSRLLDGYPGRYAVMARRAGDSWYIAGINASGEEKAVTLDLSFARHKRGLLITDGNGEREFAQRAISAGKQVVLKIRPQGGFIIQL